MTVVFFLRQVSNLSHYGLAHSRLDPGNFQLNTKRSKLLYSLIARNLPENISKK